MTKQALGAPYRELMTRNRSHKGNSVREERVLRLIRRSLKPKVPKPSASGIRVAIGDDAAIWLPRPGYETVLTCDWFLQDSHFRLNRHPPDAIGWKCLARAASDLAAMGAEPRCFLLSLALPTSRTGVWLTRFLDGLRAASQKLHCPPAGGDTTRCRDVLINIMVVGECRRGQAILRNGARPGDAIFVSGRLGEAERGLQLLRATQYRPDSRNASLRKHLYPQPRLALGAWLARHRLATAMMDLSDGLSIDLPRLCQASGVGARIEESRLPVVPLARAERGFNPVALALHGGDDYELLFTVAPKDAAKIPRRLAGTALTRIGEITTARKIVLVSKKGLATVLPQRGWDPFRLKPK